MLRRSILQISTHGSFRRNTNRITTQVPSYLSSRKKYSTVPQGSGPAGELPESGTSFPKLMFGGVTLGGAVLGAYCFAQQWEDQRKVKESDKIGHIDPPELSTLHNDLQEDKNSEPPNVISGTQGLDLHRVDIPAQEETKNLPAFRDLDDLNKKKEESQFQVKDEAEPTHKENIVPDGEKEVPSFTESSISVDDQSINSVNSLEVREDLKSTAIKPSIQRHKATESAHVEELAGTMPEENELNLPSEQQTVTEVAAVEQDPLPIGEKKSSSLLDQYNLTNKTELTTPTLSDKQEDVIGRKEDSNDDHEPKDGKLVLHFLQAIHAAENRQAELDAQIFAEEKKRLKEKYDKELKDARVREFRFAEEAALLDKERNKEKIKAAAALMSLREELEKKQEMEIEQKEVETEIKLKKVDELGKAELAAAIASEKASHIEKMAEADLHINALCMAFYARSEEACQSHSVHKLALGALALEDALSKGLSIKKEIDALNIDLESASKDPLLDLVLSSLPQETWDKGSDTLLQLKNEFDALKGSLRHFSLIPLGGGGILTHSLARVASLLKVRETDTSGDGIESLMNKVECYLAEGKLSEAADTLENGLKGTQATEVTGDWLRRARNRAITEQALTLIQSYAISLGTALSITRLSRVLGE